MCPVSKNVSGKSAKFPHFSTPHSIEKATDFNASVDFSGFHNFLWWKRWEHPAVKDAFGAAFAGFAPWLRFSGCLYFHLTPGFEPTPSSAFLDVASFLPFSTNKKWPLRAFLLVETVGVEPTSKNVSGRFSPSAADNLIFTFPAVCQQTAVRLSRNVPELPGFHSGVSCIYEAGLPICRWIGPTRGLN